MKKLWSNITGYSITAMNKQLSRIHVYPDHNV